VLTGPSLTRSFRTTPRYAAPPEDLEDDNDGVEIDADDDGAEGEEYVSNSNESQADKKRRSKEARYAAENAELDFLAKALIWDYRGQHAPRPMLAEETKEELYRLHKQDPKRWDLENLSLYFGLRKDRVQAILTFMGMRDVAVRNGEVLNGGVVELLEQEFGVVGRLADKRVLDVERAGGRPGSGLPLEEDAIDNDARLLDHARAVRLARAPRGAPLKELPPQPPKAADGSLVPEAKPHVLRRPTPTEPRSFKGTIFMERDSRRPPWGRRRRYNDATRIMYISEPDGTLRTPTWDERRLLTSADKHIPTTARYAVGENRFFKDDN
jgi:hypothetical protein